MGGVANEQVRGRLLARYPKWVALGALCSAFVLSVVHDGYVCEWTTEPPTFVRLPNHASVVEHQGFVATAIAAGLISGAIELVEDASSLICVVPLGVACNAENKLRLIWDGRHVNMFILPIKFQMEVMHREGRTVFEGCTHGSVIDITSAFHHISLHRAMTKYFGFAFQGKHYCFRSLPFGLASAPRVFAMVTRPLVELWRSRGFRVFPYVDDFPNGETSASRAFSQAQAMLRDLDNLGWLVRLDKCTGIDAPLQVFKAIGVIIDLAAARFKCPLAKLQRIQAKAVEILARRDKDVPVKWLASLAGFIVSTWIALGAVTRIRTRAMLRNVQERLLVGEDPRSKGSWKRSVSLRSDARLECQWWAEHVLSLDKGKDIGRLHPKVVVHGSMHSDASDSGWGGFISLNHSASTHANTLVQNLLLRAPAGVSVREAERSLTRGIDVMGSFSPDEAGKSSAWREVTGAERCMLAARELVHQAHLLLVLDAQTAVWGLGGEIPNLPYEPRCISGGSASLDLQKAIISLVDTVDRLEIEMSVIWRPRELNERADANSHQSVYDHCSYTIPEEIVRSIEQSWGEHTVDRFATAFNCRARSGRFNSRFWVPGCEWVDALTVDWVRELNWVHPPYGLIGETVAHFRRCRAKGTLVVPAWRNQEWFSSLLRGPINISPRMLERAPGVLDVRYLGPSSEILFYAHAQGPFEEERHLPRGHLIALCVDFSQC